MAFVTPDVEHWLEREITQWVYHEGANALTMELHLASNLFNDVLNTFILASGDVLREKPSRSN